ncbi:MAG: hypothetical protein FJ125_13775, partial [Deltaproteobacteria bacterium]|nr:hypothetical protein [Deltaproteobacteria bacterium]
MVRPTFEQVARSMKSVVSARALRAVQAVVAKGHVELITLSQDMVVARLLRGGREHVELVIDEQGGLRCHCPCRSREPFCEHGLAVLFAAAAAGPSPAGAGGDEPYPGMGREQLQSWASRHGVESWLMIRASDALHGPARFHRWVLSWEGRQLLLDVIAGPAEASRSAHGRAPLEVQRAALELLQEKKKEQELALEEEERWLARLVRPRDALVAPLWDRLRALREQVRRAARPRPAHTRGNVRIEVRLEPATLLVREQGVTALCGGGSNRAPCVTLDPGDARRPAAATCNCFRPHPEGCTVRLAAIDAALEQLASAPASAKLQELLRWLSLPAWERA